MLSAFRRLTLTESAPILRATFTSNSPAFKKADDKKPKTAKKTEKDADEAPAKKPYKNRVTSYAYFNSDFYKANPEKLGGVDIGTRSSIVSQAWKSLSASEKKVYEDKARLDGERYKKERAAYLATLPPKRPITSFLRFCNEHRARVVASNPAIESTDVIKQLADDWQALSAAEKQPYFDAYHRANDAWKLEVEKFEAAKN